MVFTVDRDLGGRTCSDTGSGETHVNRIIVTQNPDEVEEAGSSEKKESVEPAQL
jgi:hypothetical protein